MKHIPNKYIVAEIWEIQAILVWILSTQVENPYKTGFILWGIFNLLSSVFLKGLQKRGGK